MQEQSGMLGQGSTEWATDNDRDALLLYKAAGDRSAWADLVSHHSQRVWQACLQLGLSLDVTKSVSQLTWLRLVERLDRADGISNLPDWFRATIHHEASRVLGSDADVAETS